jgi:hypothetical protein
MISGLMSSDASNLFSATELNPFEDEVTSAVWRRQAPEACPSRIGGGHRHLVIGAVYTDKGPAGVDDAATRGHTDLTEPRPPGGALVAGTWTANKRCVGGAELMNDARTRELYSSPNGNR